MRPEKNAGMVKIPAIKFSENEIINIAKSAKCNNSELKSLFDIINKKYSKNQLVDIEELSRNTKIEIEKLYLIFKFIDLVAHRKSHLIRTKLIEKVEQKNTKSSKPGTTPQPHPSRTSRSKGKNRKPNR